MKKVANPKDKSLQTLKEGLSKSKKEYTYEMNGNALTVKKSEDLMLNIMKGDNNFFVVEATPFIYRGVAVFMVLGLIIVALQSVDWAWWWNIPFYLVGYFLAGVTGDAIFRQVKRKEYAPFRAEVIEAMEYISK